VTERMESEPILEVADLRKSYRTAGSASGSQKLVPALDGVSLVLHQSESLGIVGESGCGKSTLARCLVMLEHPDAGSVRYRGTEVTQARGADLRTVRGRIQMVFQDPFSSLNPRMTVRDAILEAVRVHRSAEPGEEDAFVSELLAMIGVPEAVAAKRPGRMSGGQRQRISLARAVAVRPEVLVADEIVSALDVSIQAQILNLLSDMRRRLGLSIVFISHDLAVVAQTTDRIAVMYLGRIVEEGPTARIFGNPRHPYTRALLASHPEPNDGGLSDVPPLVGEIPSIFDLPTGCRFRTRCAFATDECAGSEPVLGETRNGQSVACHVRPFDPGS